MNKILMSLVVSGALMSGIANDYIALNKTILELKKHKDKRVIGDKDKIELFRGETFNFKYTLNNKLFDESYTFYDSELTYVKGSGYMVIAKGYVLGCVESGLTDYEIYCFEPKEWYENGGHYLFNLDGQDGLYIYGESLTDYIAETKLKVESNIISTVNNESASTSNTETISTEATYTTQDIDKAKEEQKEDCKKNPESCGIEIPKVNTSLIYTQSDLDSAKEIAKDEAQIECQKDPESCGISETTLSCSDEYTIKATSVSNNETPPTIPTVQTHVLVKEQIDNLNSGWHLLGTGSIISDMNIFSNSKSIWSYKDNEWKQNPTEIKELQGFWVNK